VAQDSPTAPLTWGERLKRVFDIDISVCRLCGGTLRVIAGGRHRTSPIRMWSKPFWRI